MKQRTTFWDRIGIGLSGVCAIHCLLFPVLIALLPLWPVTEHLHQWTHPILFLLIVPTVWFALRGGHAPRRASASMLGGLLIIALAWVLHEPAGLWGEAFITLGGSVLLIYGHWLNYRSHRTALHAPGEIHGDGE